MNETSKANLFRTIAIVCVVLQILELSSCFFVFFQTQYQLVSPLIPDRTVLDIVSPFMKGGVLLCLTLLVTFLFFLYKKYTFVIILGAIALVVANFAPIIFTT